MILKQKDPVSWLQFDLLSAIPGLVHGVFSRKGGVSPAPFDSLNATLIGGDSSECVQENRLRIQQALGLPRLFSMKQVHGSDVHVIGDRAIFSPPCCDGLATQQSAVGLMVLHADCQAAIFYDPIHRAIAIVHAGWRGQVKNIYKSCVEQMAAAFGSRAQDLLVGISPSLGPHHAEFRHFEKEFPQEFWAFQERPFYFNLWEVAKEQLLACGVLSHHIEIAQLCTFSCQEEYFSYRRSSLTGRNATVVGLLE